MILGFLGKGGSGKSTLATQIALFTHSKGNTVLAIDADHNMDLSYNLTNNSLPDMKYISESMTDVKEALNMSEKDKYSDVFLNELSSNFSLSPIDSVTAKYSVEIEKNKFLMTAGPQTDTVLYGKSCSHSLTTPLKVYLPLLEIKENEFVIVDEKAGADGVSTGIITGIDVGIIVCEPAVHSIKTAKQISELMKFYTTPYIFVGNKINNIEDEKFIEKELGFKPSAYLPQNKNSKTNPSEPISDWEPKLSEIIKSANSLNENNRFERTKAKFIRNKGFNSQ